MVSGAAHVLDEALLHWLEQVLQTNVAHVQVVTGGKNNRGVRVSTGKETYFLKQYFNDDSRRFKRETDFLTLLQQHNVSHVAELLAQTCFTDAQGMLQEAALFSHLPGSLPTEDFVQANEPHCVNAIARFVAEINQDFVKHSAGHLLTARGGLGLAGEFIREIERRISTFKSLREANFNEADTALYTTLFDWLDKAFLPGFHSVEKHVRKCFSSHINAPFSRVLSPSDIGFHNTLLSADANTLSYFDFEYSGWDSAEKLVTDFYAQPRFHLSLDSMGHFVETAFPDSEPLLKNAQSLMPLAHLKWALIYLNDFKQLDSERRLFATEHQQEEMLAEKSKKRQQLEKAKHRLSLALAFIS